MYSSNDRNSIMAQTNDKKNFKKEDKREKEEEKEENKKDGVYNLCHQRLNEFDGRKDEERRECVNEKEDSRASKMPELKDELIEPDDEIVNLDLDEPPPDVMEYARREVGETDEVKCQTLQELRDLIYGN